MITPIPRKDLLTRDRKTEPTDIRQLRIGSGTYDAVTGTELNTPVRTVDKAAIEVPSSVPVPNKESPVKQADPSLSKSAAKESPDLRMPASDSAVTVDPLEYKWLDQPPTPKETPGIVSEPAPVISMENADVPQVVSPPTEQIEQSTRSSVAPIVFRERQTPSTGLEDLFVEPSAPEPAEPVGHESGHTLTAPPEPKAVPPAAGSSPSVWGTPEGMHGRYGISSKGIAKERLQLFAEHQASSQAPEEKVVGSTRYNVFEETGIMDDDWFDCVAACRMLNAYFWNVPDASIIQTSRASKESPAEAMADRKIEETVPVGDIADVAIKIVEVLKAVSDGPSEKKPPFPKSGGKDPWADMYVD